MRVVIAFLLTPLIPAAVAAIFALASKSDMNDAGFLAFLGAFYGYPAEALFGIPVFLYFRRRGWLEALPVIGVGAVIGALVPIALILYSIVAAIVMSLVSSHHRSISTEGWSSLMLLFFVPIGAMFGALCTGIFWLIALCGAKAPASEA